MNFFDHPPSKQWSVLKYRGAVIAEIWFKPEGEPLTLVLRIPAESFQNPDIVQRLTLESLLRGLGLSVDDVESCRCDGVTLTCDSEAGHEFRQPLAPPLADAACQEIHVHLKPAAAGVVESSDEPDQNELTEASDPSAQSDGSKQADESESSKAVQSSDAPGSSTPNWQDLQVRWRTILGIEANIDVLSQRVDSLRSELENSLKHTMAPDERVHALNADVAQWNKAKSRAHFSIPKAKEFIHRATWSKGAPERKQLDEIIKTYIEPQVLFPEIDKVPEQLDYLLKLRQILSAQGVAVSQECQSVASSIQSSLRTLRSNAAANAAKKRSSSREKGKHF